MNRKMDGFYFRVERDGKWDNICFTDMTVEEINEIIGERDKDWWKSLALGLKQVINHVADQFNIVGGMADDRFD